MNIWTVIEKLVAALIVGTCLVLLLRLAIGDTRRWRFDAVVRRNWNRIRLTAWRTWNWRASRRQAARAADEVIRRARGSSQVERDGNVYKPKDFKRPRKPH